MISPALSGARRIAVLRALPGLGDFLCAIPALRALRRAKPDARVVLIGLPAIDPLVARFDHLIDELLVFPGFPGIPEAAFDATATTAFLARAQAHPFDLALQMHGSGVYSNVFAALLAARRTGGFYLRGRFCPDPPLFVEYPEGEPEVRRHLRLMRHLGVEAIDETLEWPVHEEDRAEAAALGLQPHAYALVHAGASTESRRWPASRFAAVADALTERGLQVVLTGAQAEVEVVRSVSRQMTADAVDLCGRTSLGGLGALLAEARVLVANDTGIAHLATALETPSVIVFTGSDRSRWAALDHARHRAIGAGLPDRAPREHRSPAHDRPSVARVVDEIDDLLVEQVATP